MITLILLIIAAGVLFLFFAAAVCIALIRKSRKWMLISAVLLFSLCFLGFYTLSFGMKKGKETVVSVVKRLNEKIFLSFSCTEPDTAANKKHFCAFLEVEITPDVSGIYCFDDAVGQDFDYMFAFYCNAITAKRIITLHNLTKNTELGNDAEGLQDDFFWWDKKRISELHGYSWDSSRPHRKNIHKRFWFDEKNGKAYYFFFSL